MWNKLKDNLTLICTIIIICIVFWFGRSCGKKDLTPEPTKVVTTTITRTITLPKDTFIDYKITPGKPRIIHDTVPKYYLDSTQCNTLHVYEDTIKDFRYDIVSKQIVQGKLTSSDIKVRLKVPLMIKESITTKTDSLIYRSYKYEIHTGVIVGLKTIAPTFDLSIDKCTYSIGYDPFNKTPLIGFKYRLIGWSPKHNKRK